MTEIRTEGRWDKAWRFGFYALAAIFLAVFAVVVLIQNGASFLLLIAAGLCLVASRLPDISKFKLSAGGLEAELREALAEAKASVSQLQFLASENAKLALFMMQADGRWGGGGIEPKNQMRTHVLESMRKLGLSEAQIKEIQAIERPYVLFDHSLYVMGNVKLTPEQQHEWDKRFGDRSNRGVGSQATPAELRKFLADTGAITEEVEERLRDYEHYDLTGEIRRPSAWSRRFDRD